jgi:sugar phosphate isomerase/epimerase
LVDAVGEAGFAVHLDTGGMTLTGEEPAASVAAAGARCRHFHISEPFLAEVGGTTVPHGEYADALLARAYAGWVSIEMGEAKEGKSWKAPVERALAFARATYSAGGSHVRA